MITVLSLFDGMGCGKVALDRAGIKIEKYYASEIDKYARAVARKNHPDIVELGDVENWKDWKIPWCNVDLIIGGSPCQGFSFAGKQHNFNDPRSKLFFTYRDILNHVRQYNPNVKFLLENVRMKKEYLDIITKTLGVSPILINSALVSAQDRKRYYWTNINGITQPKDKGILLSDIVHERADMDYEMKESWCKWFGERMEYLINKKWCAISPDKAITMTAKQYNNWQGNFIFEVLENYIISLDETFKILENEVSRRRIGVFGKGGQGSRIYTIFDKSVALCGEAGGRGAKTGLYLFGVINPDKERVFQNGIRFKNNGKFYTLTATDRHGILTEGYVRKLTPIECERLQTLPDNYTLCEIKGKKISDNQRYRMLGNGWTVDVIAHILGHLNTEDKG